MLLEMVAGAEDALVALVALVALLPTYRLK